MMTSFFNGIEVVSVECLTIMNNAGYGINNANTLLIRTETSSIMHDMSLIMPDLLFTQVIGIIKTIFNTKPVQSLYIRIYAYKA